MIVEKATEFFAEHGLGASTSELAAAIGVAQPLLYRYFATKDALIQRIYESLRAERYDPNWVSILDDSSTDLVDRLSRFYIEYSGRALTYAHSRLAMYVRANNLADERKYYGQLRQRIFPRIVKAMREEFGVKLRGDPTEGELEIAQTLHGAVVHLAQRRWAHTPSSVRGDFNELIRLKVRLILEGARVLYKTARIEK